MGDGKPTIPRMNLLLNDTEIQYSSILLHPFLLRFSSQPIERSIAYPKLGAVAMMTRGSDRTAPHKRKLPTTTTNVHIPEGIPVVGSCLFIAVNGAAPAPRLAPRSSRGRDRGAAWCCAVSFLVGCSEIPAAHARTSILTKESHFKSLKERVYSNGF